VISDEECGLFSYYYSDPEPFIFFLFCSTHSLTLLFFHSPFSPPNQRGLLTWPYRALKGHSLSAIRLASIGRIFQSRLLSAPASGLFVDSIRVLHRTCKAHVAFSLFLPSDVLRVGERREVRTGTVGQARHISPSVLERGDKGEQRASKHSIELNLNRFLLLVRVHPLCVSLLYFLPPLAMMVTIPVSVLFLCCESSVAYRCTLPLLAYPAAFICSIFFVFFSPPRFPYPSVHGVIAEISIYRW